jgi:hypothetical protein
MTDASVELRSESRNIDSRDRVPQATAMSTTTTSVATRRWPAVVRVVVWPGGFTPGYPTAIARPRPRGDRLGHAGTGIPTGIRTAPGADTSRPRRSHTGSCRGVPRPCQRLRKPRKRRPAPAEGASHAQHTPAQRTAGDAAMNSCRSPRTRSAQYCARPSRPGCRTA